jgi:hypothetical protein
LRCRKIVPGVEIKSTGGYVVWHPASAGRVLCEGPIAEWALWILEILGNSHSAAALSAEG